VRQLKEVNQQLLREMEDLRMTITRLQGTTTASDSSCPPSRLIRTTAQKRLPRDECRRCEGKGHWARKCKSTFGSAARSQQATTSSNTARVNHITAKRKKVAVYITIQYNGMDFKALLDSGCNVSVLGRRILPDLPYDTPEPSSKM